MALRFCVRLFLGLISVSIGSEAQASDLLEKDIAQVYGEAEEVVSIAAGYRQPLDLAPAVATVITAEEIRAMGATTLDQVIETVAGVHLSTPDDIVNVLSFRGIPSRVLILVNNIPVPQGLVNAFAPRGSDRRALHFYVARQRRVFTQPQSTRVPYV